MTHIRFRVSKYGENTYIASCGAKKCEKRLSRGRVEPPMAWIWLIALISRCPASMLTAQWPSIAMMMAFMTLMTLMTMKSSSVMDTMR